MSKSKGTGLVTEEAMKELFGKQYTNQRKKENLLESHHILSFSYDSDFKCLSGKVKASQTKSLVYNVSVSSSSLHNFCRGYCCFHNTITIFFCRNQCDLFSSFH